MSPAIQLNWAGELDALAAVLPMSSADRYAEVLTDADVATLKHLAGTLPAGNHALRRVGEGRSRTV